jgi:uncharacterized protein
MRSRIASLAGHLLVLGCALGGAFVSAFARADTAIPPPPVRYVTDRAAFLSTASAAELDARLADYSSQTGHQLLVYIDRTTGGIPIEDWAAKAFQNWKVGRQRIDDGLVLFVFSDDHRLRIEVGYGLEARVTDALVSRIINDRMVPLIRAGDRDGAIRTGVDALEAAMGTAGTSPPPAAHVPVWQLVLGALALLFVLGFAVTHPGLASLMMMSIGSGRGGGGWGGGGGGSGGGGFSGGGGSSGGGGASGSW